MPTIHLKGRLWPFGVKVTLPQLRFDVQHSSGGFETFHFRCEDSVVLISCDLVNFDENDPESIGDPLARAKVLVDGAVSLGAVMHGTGIEFLLDTVVLPDGRETEFRMMNSAVVGLITAVKNGVDFARTMEDITKNWIILLALSDLNMAISRPNYLAVACGRAVDSIRNVIAGVDKDPNSVGWPKMREALNADRAYLTFVTHNATRPRHGERLHGDVNTEREVLRRSWTLMNRLILYRRMGSIPLTDPDFPLLTG